MRARFQANAFLVRSLRQEARLASHHFFRGALTATIFLLVCLGLYTYSSRGGVGGNIVWRVLYSCYWFVTLLGGIYFSTSIVEEKEEQTLPLLRMTGASAAAILLGKSIPRLTSVLLMLLVIAPFILLSVTLGGVHLQGVLTAMLSILVYAVMISQVGVLASVVSRDAQRAFSKTLCVWALLEFLPTWGYLGGYALLAWIDVKTIDAAQALLDSADAGLLESWGAWLAIQSNQVSLWSQDLVLGNNLTTILGGFFLVGPWTPQMTFHLCIAAGCFLLSWMSFEFFTSRVVAEGPAAGTKSRRRSARPWPCALIWKSWYYQGGGWLWTWIRLLLIPTLIALIAAIVLWAADEREFLYPLGMALILCGVVVAIAHVAILFGRLFSSEVKEKTVSSLLLIPMSRHRMVAETLVGMLPAVFASLSSLVIGFAVLLYEASRRGWAGPTFHEDIWFYQLVMLGITSVMIGVRLSIKMTYGGMLLSVLTCWIAGPIAVVFLAETLRMAVGWQAMNEFMDDVLPRALFFVEVPLCLWSYFSTVRTLERIGERE